MSIEYKFSIKGAGETREFGIQDKVPMKPGKEVVLRGYFEHKGKELEVIVAEHWEDYDKLSKTPNTIKLRKQEMLRRADYGVLNFILK